MKDLSHYGLLAELFRYPSSDLKNYIGTWEEIIAGYDPGLARKLDPFIAHIKEQTLSYQQEYYVGTFDVQAMCFLDIGYVLFGEDYKRGVFLVNIKKEQIKAANDCGSELPDHLPNILTLLPKMKDPDLAEELIYSLLIPAVHTMILRFRSQNNVYKGLLELLMTIMESDYPFSTYEKIDTSNIIKAGHPELYSEDNKNMV
jgi:nitrate reductase molybdenum cofactor assembly chaperone